MAVDLAQMAAQDAAYNQQATAALKAQQAEQQQPQTPPTLASRGMEDPGHVTGSKIDSFMNEMEQWGTDAKRVGQDVASGVVTGATNTADAVGSAISTSGREMAAAEDPAHAEDARAGVLPTSPIWDHAKSAIMDFRDAIAVKDPNIVDGLTQAGAQLAVPFAAYSRALSGLHGIANAAAAGGITDLTALQPQDMRTADLIALGRQTDTKVGAVLRQMGPYGLNAYVNFLADRSNPSEAEGRFKNALDGLGANMILTPLLHAAGVVVKQGQTALRSMVDNDVRSPADLMPQADRRGADRLPDDEYKGLLKKMQDGSLTGDEQVKLIRALNQQGQPAAAAPAPADAGWTLAGTGTEPGVFDKDPAAKGLQSALLTAAKGGGRAPAGTLIDPLVKALPDTTEGKFYSDILQRLKDKVPADLQVHGYNSYYDNAGAQVAPRTYRGQYRPGIVGPGSVHMYPSALSSPTQTVQTFTHELVHAATFDHLEHTDFLPKAIDAMRAHGKEQFGELGDAMYGFKNKHEFVAEIESNPDFQRAMRRTQMGDGRTVWEHYREAIGGILGIGAVAAASPMFERLLSKEKNGA